MAEYILKTELPITTCRVCPVAEHTPFGTVCTIKRCAEKRYGTCPLVELPEKHGRIVDLDKVLDWLINEDDRFSIVTCAKIDNALKNAPVIMEASE